MSKFIIIGDGIAGATAAEQIRNKDKDADISIFTDDSEPLYNRIMLKTYMKGSLPLQYTRMHDEKWYDKRDIEIHLNTLVSKVEQDKREIITENGERHSYDYLLVAAGGNPRELEIDEGYSNVHYMWSMSDAEIIKESAEESGSAVVIGGGLLGIDLAVAYAENGCDTYYLIRENNWWNRGLDSKGAEIIHSKLENKGVNVMTNTEAEEFVAEDGEVISVITDRNQEINCDAVSIAIGQEPNSDIIDVEKNQKNMIKTNEFLQTSYPNVFAAGNMVEYKSPVFERRLSNGSWDHSEAMGARAGKNMFKKSEGEELDPFTYINTYGVGHFDVQFLAIGDWTGKPISKKYDEDEYRRLFFDDGKLVGAVLIGFVKGQEKIKELIAGKEEIEDKDALLKKDFWK